jgi:hypothetical protein
MVKKAEIVRVHRVVPDPRPPLSELAELVEKPEDLEELLALRAMTDPAAADALESLAIVPAADRYLGPRAAIVMAPFFRLAKSRFSPGTYGVLYSADALPAAVSESAHHAARYLGATHAGPTTVPRYALRLDLDAADHVDVRRGGAHDARDERIYDPGDYGTAQAHGRGLRNEGHAGVWYDSVRAPGGTCYGTFRPAAVQSVSDEVRELELVWDGSRITEYREITTRPL